MQQLSLNIVRIEMALYVNSMCAQRGRVIWVWRGGAGASQVVCLHDWNFEKTQGVAAAVDTHHVFAPSRRVKSVISWSRKLIGPNELI